MKKNKNNFQVQPDGELYQVIYNSSLLVGALVDGLDSIPSDDLVRVSDSLLCFEMALQYRSMIIDKDYDIAGTLDEINKLQSQVRLEMDERA